MTYHFNLDFTLLFYLLVRKRLYHVTGVTEGFPRYLELVDDFRNPWNSCGTDRPSFSFFDLAHRVSPANIAQVVLGP